MKLSLRAPHTKYPLKDGSIAVGMTTALNVYAKEALYGWYASMEREGIIDLVAANKYSGRSTLEWLLQALPYTDEGKPRWFATMKRDKAADLGTVGHAHIEAWFAGEGLEPDGIDPQMFRDGLIIRDRFLDWYRDAGLSAIHSEHKMVSEEWRCGGTGDLFAEDRDGRLVYVDVKSSKPWYQGRPYDENVAQQAGYRKMFRELYGREVERGIIARTGSALEDSGTFWEVSPEQNAEGEALAALAVASYYCKRRLGDALKLGATAGRVPPPTSTRLGAGGGTRTSQAGGTY